MSFTEKQLPTARQKQFAFFATGTETNGEMTESLIPEYNFELEKIRLTLSAGHASVVDFTVTLSHHLDSTYNQNVLSQAMNGVKDVLLQFNPTIKLFEDDTLDFSLIISTANSYGIEVSGWSITVPSR